VWIIVKVEAGPETNDREHGWRQPTFIRKVAQSLSISPRYLQRLLKSSGTSSTAHVTERRLKHAFMLFTAEDLIDVRICDIALQAGFSDISHFNRLSGLASAARQATCA